MDLTNKIITYLERERDISLDSDQESRQEIIDYFKESEWQCVGHSKLWLYGKRISDQENHEGKIRDDAEFFFAVQELLNSWDDLKKLINSVERDGLLSLLHDEELGEKVKESIVTAIVLEGDFKGDLKEYILDNYMGFLSELAKKIVPEDQSRILKFIKKH